MNLLNPGVHYLCIYEKENDRFIRIKGNDISPSSTLESETLTRGVSSKGGVVQLNKKWELNLQYADTEVFQEVSTWPKTSEYYLFAYKLNGFIMWQEPVTVHFDETALIDPESEDYPYTLRLSFIGPNPQIKESVNAVAPWRGIDQDPNWSYTGVDSLSFADGIQTVNTVASGECNITFELDLGARKENEGNVDLYRRASFGLYIETMPDSGSYTGSFTRLSNLYRISDDERLGAFSASAIEGVGFVGFGSKNTGFEPILFRVELNLSSITSATSFSFSRPMMYQRLQSLTEDDIFLDY